MLFHRCQHAKVALYTAVVVVDDVILNHRNEFFSAREPSAIVSFPFQDAPESFHWSIVDSFCYSGHALLHLCFLQLVINVLFAY